MQRMPAQNRLDLYIALFSMVLPYLFLAVFLMDGYITGKDRMWICFPLFLGTMLPCSIISLVFLRDKNLYIISESKFETLRNVLYVLASFGIVIGIFCWMLILVVTY